jgi:YHS domain-containing protein
LSGESGYKLRLIDEARIRPTGLQTVRNISRRNVVLGLAAASGSALGGTVAAAAEDAPLAIKGYDPVAYFTSGKPTPGSPELEYEWDEQRYRFATAAHRELFKADPLRYAPQFANFCAVALARGEIYEGQPEYWLINDGKLYLFAKPTGAALFSRNLSETVSKASENSWMVRPH